MPQRRKDTRRRGNLRVAMPWGVYEYLRAHQAASGLPMSRWLVELCRRYSAEVMRAALAVNRGEPKPPLWDVMPGRDGHSPARVGHHQPETPPLGWVGALPEAPRKK